VRRAEYGQRVRAFEQAKRDGRVHEGEKVTREVHRNYSRPNSDWLLVNSIFDRKTGSPLKPYRCGPEGSYRYYYLATDRTNPTSQRQGKRKFFPADAVEDAVLRMLSEVVEASDEIRPLVEHHVRERLRSVSGDVSDLEQLRGERERVRRKKAFALDQFEDLGPDLLASKVAPMTAAIRKLDERIVDAERHAGTTPSDAPRIVESVMQAIRDVAKVLGEPTSAALRCVVSALTRTTADAEAREAEIEIRIPVGGFVRPGALAQLCESVGSVHSAKQMTQVEEGLTLAKFNCKRTTVNRSPCLACNRMAA
jgi:hypothetical protein